MVNDGLLVVPNLEDTDQYLKGGTRTEIIDVSSIIKKDGLTDGGIVRQILFWMHANLTRLDNDNDNDNDKRKFKRSAAEILQSGEITGCCDSCTLFTSLARSAGIPTMQIISFNKEWGKNIKNQEEKLKTSGHFFVGIYLKDIYGNSNWFLLDPDRYVKNMSNINEVRFQPLYISNRNIGNQYIFAYVKDYFDDLGIDSVKEMKNIQLAAYKKCNKNDFEIEKEER